MSEKNTSQLPINIVLSDAYDEIIKETSDEPIIEKNQILQLIIKATELNFANQENKSLELTKYITQILDDK